jgi:signal peptidase I
MRTIAVLFNLIVLPGGGHIAMGRWRRGLPWIAAVALAPVAALIHPLAMLVLFFGTRIGSAVEVGLLARGRQLSSMQSLAAYGGGLVGSILWFSVMRMFVVEAFKIPSAAMIPTLEIGDHLFVNKLSYAFGEPARGDVAVFVNPCEPDKDFVMRIVGLPGDTIEVRCDVLYLNGVAAPATSLKEDCSYWDRPDPDAGWRENRCTTYVETIAEHQHEIVHGPERRERDKLRKLVAGERGYHELLGDGDFPEPERIPACPQGDPVGRVEKASAAPTGACSPREHYVVPEGHVFVMGDNREYSSDSRRWGPVPLDHLTGKVTSIWWSSKPDAQGGVAWDRIGPVD